VRKHGALSRCVTLMLLALGVASGAAASAAAAGTLRWSAGYARGAGDLIGVACPARTLCVAVNSAGKVVVSKRPSAGAHTWKVIHDLTILQQGGTLAQQIAAARVDTEAYDVSCPSVHLCLIGRPGAGSIGSPVGSIVHTTNPLGGASAWHTVNGIGTSGGQIDSISCPSAHVCYALDTKVDQFGNGFATPLVSTNPTGGAATWNATGPDINDYFQGLSCPSAALCVAGGGSGLYWTHRPLGPMSPWQLATTEPAQVDSVSCPSTSLCLAQPDLVANGNNDIISTNPAAGHWHRTPVATNGLTCPSTSLCVGAAWPGLAVWSSTHPAGGATAWHLTKIRKSSKSLRTASCASARFCVAVGDGGSIAVGQRAG
jgi:hypothetical protein